MRLHHHSAPVHAAPTTGRQRCGSSRHARWTAWSRLTATSTGGPSGSAMRAGLLEVGHASISSRCRPRCSSRRSGSSPRSPSACGGCSTWTPTSRDQRASRTGSIMARLVAARPALRVFGGWDPFEVAMRTINGQQVSVERARHLNGVLVARCGATAAHRTARALTDLFPTAARGARCGSRRHGHAGRTRRGTEDDGRGRRRRSGTVRHQPGRWTTRSRGCAAIKGIGEWTAHYIAMRACRQPDAFPASDVGLLRGAATRTAFARRPRHCWRAPRRGGRGAPMRRIICGTSIRPQAAECGTTRGRCHSRRMMNTANTTPRPIHAGTPSSPATAPPMAPSSTR